VFPSHLSSIEGSLCLIEDQHMLWRDQVRTLGIRRDIRLHAADECFSIASCATKLVLEHLDKGAVSGEIHGRGCRLPIGSRDREVVEEPGMRQLEPDQRLTCSGQPGQQDQTACLRARRLARDLRDQVQSRPGLLVNDSDPPDLAGLQQLSCRLNKGRKGAIRTRIEEAVERDCRPGEPRRRIGYQLVECLRPEYFHHPVAGSPVASPHQDQRRNDHSVGTLPVIAAKVAGIGRGLVEVHPSRHLLALQFQDDDRAAGEKNDVGSSMLHRQPVLEDGRELVAFEDARS